MKNKKKARELVLKAMQNADPTIRSVEDNQTITGYYGFDSIDMYDYISYIESHIGFQITEDDIKKRMSSTVGEAVQFLYELTIDKNAD